MTPTNTDSFKIENHLTTSSIKIPNTCLLAERGIKHQWEAFLCSSRKQYDCCWFSSIKDLKSNAAIQTIQTNIASVYSNLFMFDCESGLSLFLEPTSSEHW